MLAAWAAATDRCAIWHSQGAEERRRRDGKAAWSGTTVLTLFRNKSQPVCWYVKYHVEPRQNVNTKQAVNSSRS